MVRHDGIERRGACSHFCLGDELEKLRRRVRANEPYDCPTYRRQPRPDAAGSPSSVSHCATNRAHKMPKLLRHRHVVPPASRSVDSTRAHLAESKGHRQDLTRILQRERCRDVDTSDDGPRSDQIDVATRFGKARLLVGSLPFRRSSDSEEVVSSELGAIVARLVAVTEGLFDGLEGDARLPLLGERDEQRAVDIGRFVVHVPAVRHGR